VRVARARLLVIKINDLFALRFYAVLMEQTTGPKLYFLNQILSHLVGRYAIFFWAEWSSMKQPSISRSNIKLEYKSVEVQVLSSYDSTILKELGIVQQRVPCLWCNNMGAKVSFKASNVSC
jgi:hypothetical protein